MNHDQHEQQHEQKEALRQAMEEVVALPADNPRRIEVLRQVETAGAWAHTYWADLVREQEQWRLELRDVATPEGLNASLKAIPDQVANATHRRWWAMRYRAAAVLAAACLALAALLLVNLRSEAVDFEQAAHHVARLAVEDHHKRPELSIASSERNQVASHLQPHVAFAVDVPPMEPTLSLIGGRICAFDERPIAHTRWQHDGKEHSVYQFCAADFDLPEHFMPTRIEVPAIPGQSQAYDVLIWSAGVCAYVMVCEGPLPAVAGRMDAIVY